jgi:hypothetical protein
MKREELFIRPIEAGVSIIDENPIGVLEKLGKYEFVYDYKIPTFLDIIYTTSFTKERASNADMIAPSGFYSGKYFPQPIYNQNAQVGFFSKGNIVNVLRFDGNNAIIQNPNYVEPDPNAPKSVGFFDNFGDIKKQQEFTILKEYLRKVDDTLEPTLLTGINYGANMKQQPNYVYPVKPIPFNPVTQTILEENASFVLARDFQYVSGYGSSIYDEESGIGTADMSPKYAILKAGTKVSGRLFRETNNITTLYKIQMGGITPLNYKDYLAVKGYGSQGSINIPIEYLTKEVPTNSDVVVPVKNDNKNLLMIVGAFLLGYALFSKDDSST